MPARCPECHWRLGFFGIRPKSRSTFACPKCGRALLYRGQERLVQVAISSIALPTLVLIRIDEPNGHLYAVFGIGFSILLVFIGKQTERLDRAEDFEERKQ
jgi:predicted RNA-binding Zn-ribbon protein involved in translation (DUF1610 family)